MDLGADMVRDQVIERYLAQGIAAVYEEHPIWRQCRSDTAYRAPSRFGVTPIKSADADRKGYVVRRFARSQLEILGRDLTQAEASGFNLGS
jgi:hypothetical protein